MNSRYVECDKIYVLKNLSTNKILYKYRYDNIKLIYLKKAYAQKALNDLLRIDPSANISIEEVELK